MNRSLRVCLAALLSSSIGLTACGAPANADGDEDLVAVSPGKADNYYSNVGAEFELTGSIPLVLTAEEAADKAKLDEAVARRLTAVTLYLTAYLTAKFRGIDRNNDGVISDDEVFFRNEGYGDFKAMVRNFSTETLEISEVEGSHIVRFTVDIAGPTDLLQKIPRADGQPAGTFALQLPKGASIDPANVPRGTFRSFDPKGYSGELETILLAGRRLPDPANAYPQHRAFVEDGLFDITFFFGHDYNASRSDLEEARQTYDWLLRKGYSAPAGVRKFEDVGSDVGPFTRTLKAGGKDVRVEVRIFHAEQWLGRPAEQKQRLLDELVARDVFFYPGHAGPYFGFYIDGARAADVSYRSLASAPFSDKQQLLVAQGCQTYGNYADMIYAHPQKSEGNYDVITTVNYSYGQGTLGVLEALVGVDGAGNHKPLDYYSLIGRINAEYWNREENVIYGVHGMDGNPQLHPWASPDRIGEACSRNVDCGDPNGNRCVSTSSGKQCAAVALAAAACPTGSEYQLATSGTSIVGGLCVKR